MYLGTNIRHMFLHIGASFSNAETNPRNSNIFVFHSTDSEARAA
jgi:hypothetical protein